VLVGGPRCIVIGAGFGGLGAARALRRAGIADITVLERADAVGGVWRDNTYPGAACDVPSPLYSWSWSLNPTWSHRYSPQSEILAYLERAAGEAGLLDLVRRGQEVCEAAYDEATAVWSVRTTDGTAYEAEVLVSAVGQLSDPVVPDLPGLESFAGPAFHSARWRHDVPLEGARVAVVGTGASAIQFVPAIVDRVASLTVFQRSAPYVVPKPDTEYRPFHHRLLDRHPVVMRGERGATFHLTELLNRALGGDSAIAAPFMATMRRVWKAQLRLQVKDAALRARLEPDYPIGCKRILFSNDWYPALARDHVEVVTDAVTAVEPGGVVSADGHRHEADVLIWGTGFAATDFLRTIRVTGRDGVELHDVWKDGASAYLGIGVPGFPNLFCVYGPNTNLGGSSIIGMMEAQAGWIAQVVRRVAEGDRRAGSPPTGRAWSASTSSAWPRSTGRRWCRPDGATAFPDAAAVWLCGPGSSPSRPSSTASPSGGVEPRRVAAAPFAQAPSSYAGSCRTRHASRTRMASPPDMTSTAAVDVAAAPPGGRTHPGGMRTAA
jgi:cation diffusion facilitator CzcD-associated flavoprotein CzcO